MTQPSQKHEFHYYRQALLVLYVAAWTVFAALLIGSVTTELFGKRGEHTAPPNPADLTVCNHEVRALVDDLGQTAARLQEQALSGSSEDLGRLWDEFAKQWQIRWEMVNTRCQFDELSDTGLGPAYDRMAWVHRNLPTMKLKYRELMKRFTDEQAGELSAMRHALDTSAELLSRAQGNQHE